MAGIIYSREEKKPDVWSQTYLWNLMEILDMAMVSVESQNLSGYSVLIYEMGYNTYF